MELRKMRKGFSIIELIFAVVILAGGLTVLLGLQSAATTSALRDRNQQQAMLIARSVMSALEITEKLSDSNFNGTAEDLLNKYKQAISDAPDYQDIIKQTQANLAIQSVEVPIVSKVPVQPIKMFRTELTLSWGKSPDDNLTIIYYINKT